MTTITQRAAVKLILNSKKVITVTFLKRTMNYTERRIMRCRIKMQDKRAIYNGVQNQLITVWDEDKQAYRSIPTEGIVGININGTIYTITI